MYLLLVLQPLIYICIVFLLSFYTTNVLKFVPNFTHSTGLITSTSYIPKIPNNPATVIKLYQLEQKLGQQNDESILKLASNVAKFEFKNIEQFQQLMDELKSTPDEKLGVIGKFWKLMTLINVIWIVSIIGMTVTFFPAIVAIFGPLMNVLVDFVKRIIKSILPYSEQIGYVLLIFILSQSFYCPKDIGFFLALTSLVGYYSLFIYTCNKHGQNVTNESTKSLYSYGMILLPTAMLTIYYNSDLLGFLSIVFLYFSFGFSVISRGLCWCIGFRDRDPLTDCTCISLALIPLYLVMDKKVAYLKHFHYGIYVMSVIIYFLGLLILSSKYKYGKTQILMIISLILFAFIGSIMNITSMYNVTITFSFLYLGEKIGEMSFWKGFEIVLVFLGFLTCYFASMLLTAHPSFLTAIIFDNN